MASEPTTHPRPSFMAVALYYATYVLIFGIVGLTLFLGWPGIVATFQARMGGAPPAQPTAPAVATPRVAAPAPLSDTIGSQAAPIPDIAQNGATASAMYDATAQAANVLSVPPNVDTTGDSAPLIHESQASDRQGAGENVPTAEPIVEPQSGGIFGSKPVVVNPQETHQCLHGAVWTEAGCKNPTPVGGG